MEATTLMIEELKIIEDAIPANNTASRRIAISSAFALIEILLSDISALLIRMIPPPVNSARHEENHRYFLELCALSNLS